MALFKILLTLFIYTACGSSLFAIVADLSEKFEQEGSFSKQQIPYLMRIGQTASSIQLYQEYIQKTGKHDFEIIEQMATILLEQGARSQDPEKELLSIYGAMIGGYWASADILEAGILSQRPETQMATIQFLAKVQDDLSDELLIKAMSSPFFFVRVQAAYQLAVRKHRSAVGHIETLMHRVPKEMRYFFAEFFAMIGTKDAMLILKHMMDDSHLENRIAAILQAAQYQRDDLLLQIRNRLCHLNGAEQEACAAAVGYLKDSASLPQLKKLHRSSFENVQLASYKALYQLGDPQAAQEITSMAKKGNLFAIALLADIHDSEETLVPLLSDNNLQIRFNAAIALLRRRNPRCLSTILEILIRDSRGLGFHPQFSLGQSLMAWKVMPSSQQHMKDSFYDIEALSLHFREQILKLCLELPEENFLKIASLIFDSKQTELIPLLIHLLENLQTPQAIELLQKKSQTAGAPLLRMYCHLALFRLNSSSPSKESLKEWIRREKKTDLIRFRPVTPWSEHRAQSSSFELTPEESSRLLIETYEALAMCHDDEGIHCLLEAIKEGNLKNRYVLAGLLIRAIQ